MLKKIHIFGAITLTALLAITSIGQANRLNDLVGGAANTGSQALQSRGYHLTHSQRGDDRLWEYWWNSSSKHCVSVSTMRGRFSAITDTMPFDCNQNEASSNNGKKAAVGIGIAAAAIIGAIALSHKSNHHENNTHIQDVNSEAEYERGYRDGLYNKAYHNYSNTEHYKAGFGAGVNQRHRETDYHPGNGYGGYRPFVKFNDLVGIRASSGESELESRGFRMVDNFTSGTTRYNIWFHNRTRQCLQVAVADGRYDSLTGIQTHPRCK